MVKITDLRPLPKLPIILQNLPGGTFYTPEEGSETSGEVFVLTNEKDVKGRRVSVWVGSLTGSTRHVNYQNVLDHYFYIDSWDKGYVLNIEITVKP